jgi:hypothetical protein
MRHDTPAAPSEIGIPIGTHAFKKLVDRYQTVIDNDLKRKSSDSDPEPTVDDYVSMVRIWNTIVFMRMGTNEPALAHFASSFLPAYAERISRALGALPTKGMALYSKQYDLYIGGKPHANSQYRLIADP